MGIAARLPDKKTNSMKQQHDVPKRIHEKHQAYLDDRMQLLETIRELIDIELDRWAKQQSLLQGPALPEKSPAKRRSLWQRIAAFFSVCLL